MDDYQLIIRLREILVEVDSGLITDEQAIKKLMRSYAKYQNTLIKELEKMSNNTTKDGN